MAPPPPEGSCFPTPAQALLLRAALLDGDAAREAFRAWRAAVDPEALDGGSYRLLPLLAKNLLRLGVADAHLDRWKGTYRRVFVANEVLFREMDPVLEALERAGVPALLLKGAALVAGVYRESGLRPMADLDVLVPRAHAPRAFAALRAIGWRSQARHPERQLEVRHGSPFASPAGLELDLHWSLLWEDRAPGADDGVWAAAIDGRLGRRAVRTPCAADQLLHVCVHGLQWAWEPQIRWAGDALLLARSGAVDWERLARECARRRVALPVRTALRWIRERLDAPVPGATLAALDAIAVTAAERSDLDAKLRPMRGLASLRVYWSHHRRASEARGRGALATAAAFLPFLQHSWGVDHLVALPHFLLYRGLRRLWIDSGLGDAPRPKRPPAPARVTSRAPAPRPEAPRAPVAPTLLGTTA